PTPGWLLACYRHRRGMVSRPAALFRHGDHEVKHGMTTIGEYRLLGRTGLRVAPMCLGTGTFGQSWGPGWTIEKAAAREVFRAYVEAGGNFLDTANGYQGGESEVWLGELLREHGERDRMVVATKF